MSHRRKEFSSLERKTTEGPHTRYMAIKIFTGELFATEVDSGHFSVLRRSWLRVTNLPTLDRSLVIVKNNCTFHANLGHPTQFIHLQLPVLYTGTAPNLVHKGLEPPVLRISI